WIVPARGGTAERLTQLGENVEHLRFSPDGAALFAAADQGGNERFDLLRVDLSRASSAWLARTPRSETEPVPAPDGRSLAFTGDADVAFRPHLFVRDLASAEERRLTREDPPVYEPTWSADAKRIAVVQTPDFQ